MQANPLTARPLRPPLDFPRFRRPKHGSAPVVSLYVAILAILLLDWMTPAGIVVGFLLCIPILAASIGDDPRHIWGSALIAAAGFVIAATLGRGPIAPTAVWVPNQIFAFSTLPASCLVSLLLQRRRLGAERVRDRALSDSDLNHLLMSLLAHDLRAPLSLASQGFQYVEHALAFGQPVDRALVADTRARLQRSLRAIEIVLAVARSESASQGPRAVGGDGRVARVREEIEAEIACFAEEAAARGKRLVTELDALNEGEYPLDGLVLRQVLAILVDNAIRYSDPGTIRIRAAATDSEVTTRVSDPGPGVSAHRAANPSSPGGSGLGLELSRALAERADGSLRLERDGGDGTCFVLRLPCGVRK